MINYFKSPDSLLIDRVLIYKTESNQNFNSKINIYVSYPSKILNNLTFEVQIKILLKYLFLIFFSFSILSCKTERKTSTEILQQGDTIPVTHAHGFSIVQFPGYKLLTVKDPWPKADITYTYLLAEEGSNIPGELEYHHKITIPVNKIVVTSTTHIPSLEALGEENSLTGFPGLDYISSEKTRKRIHTGKITELGRNEAINTEVLISLEPSLVVGFAVNGGSKTFSTIEKSGIPVLFNGDWTEESPLGKAEWIKFFGALYNKSDEAERLFKEVENSYNEAKELATKATKIPTVLSGSMYKDQWYVPYGNSWSARFIKDANAEYIYKESRGSGSMALAFESVLSDAGNADFWIAPGQFGSFKQLIESSSHYTRFKAVKNKNVFTYSNTTGNTGGVLYYELGPSRPDLILKDLISIFHPSLMPGYEPAFFKPLQ